MPTLRELRCDIARPVMGLAHTPDPHPTRPAAVPCPAAPFQLTIGTSMIRCAEAQPTRTQECQPVDRSQARAQTALRHPLHPG